VTLLLIIVAVIAISLVRGDNTKSVVGEGETPETAFARNGLKTNTSMSSIPLSDVLSGGPGKDGIPALSNPLFVSVEEAEVNDTTLGVFISIDEEKRFYPYNILVWHEIVNDSIGDTHFAVTFCPLCGSAITFNREVGGEVLTFGVSGLLWESNLLMYDTKTESLWSQAKNEAVIGDYIGTKLSLLDMRLLEFGTIKELHPDSRVLSRDTGYARSYDIDPYGDYETNDRILFPVSVSDSRFSAKEIMYVVPFNESSYAFPDSGLDETTTFEVADGELVLERLEEGVQAYINGNPLPGYYEMWFSWATHHQNDGVVLGGSTE
jgi:hypothetical protein